jgi:hypothetical protein
MYAVEPVLAYEVFCVQHIYSHPPSFLVTLEKPRSLRSISLSGDDHRDWDIATENI